MSRTRRLLQKPAGRPRAAEMREITRMRPRRRARQTWLTGWPHPRARRSDVKGAQTRGDERARPTRTDESPTLLIPTQVARAMKLAVCLLAAPVAGLVAPAAPARTATVLNAEMSKALPFLTAPKGLKGYIGEEAGFDPVGFAEIMDIKWMREAEIKHGRVAMLATIGYTYPEMPWFAQAFPGDAYSHSNPIKAALAVPPEAGAGPPLLRCGVMAEWRILTRIDGDVTLSDSTSTAHLTPRSREGATPSPRQRLYA